MDWFRHDLSAQQDIKIRKLIRKYGYEGYGLYWHAVELLYQNNGSMSIQDLDNEFDLLDQTTFPKDLEDLGLITIKEGYVSSSRIHQEIDRAVEYTSKKSEAGKKGNEIRWQAYRKAIANASQSDSTPIADVSQTIAQTNIQTNIHTEKVLTEVNTKERRFVKPDVDQIRAYCLERKNGIDPDYFFNYYEVRNWIPSGARTQMKDWKRAIITWELRNKRSLPKPKICNDADAMRSSMNASGGFDL